MTGWRVGDPGEPGRPRHPVAGAAPCPDPARRDELLDGLGDLVAHLTRLRDAGCRDARTLREQEMYRRGFNAALRAVLSKRWLLATDEG